MSEPTTVGAFEAKTHLSQLLERAANGETITITRRGTPIARLVPIDPAPMKADELVEALIRARAGARLDGLEVRELMEEGRR